jgi:hypothetical protein
MTTRPAFGDFPTAARHHDSVAATCTTSHKCQGTSSLDQSAEQLIIHAAEQRGLHHNPSAPLTPATTR